MERQARHLNRERAACGGVARWRARVPGVITATVGLVALATATGLIVPGISAAERSATVPPAPARPASDVVIPPESSILAGLSTSHPRLILTPAGVTALKARIATDATSAAMYAQVKARANALLSVPPVTYDKPDGIRLLETCREVVRRMYDLGLVWLVDSDPAIAARAWAELDAVTSFPDWNPLHFLDTAEMTHAVSIGYDWLYDALTTAQRAKLVSSIRDMGLAPARDSYSGKAVLAVSYWVVVDHNWNNVVNGGETIGALAIGDIEPGIASYVAHEALVRLPVALKNYSPDGGWPEGVSYWEYATEYTGYAVASLQSALGTDFGLSAIDGFAQTGEVPIHMTGPTGQRFNWADDGEPRYAPAVPFEFWLADHFGRQAFRDYGLAHLQPAALDVVWYRPSAALPETLPPDRLFSGIDVATMRSAWDDPNATWVGAKGGNAGFNHNQLDLGSFVLESQGERFAIDLGKENYNLPGYWEVWPGGRRWVYYRSRAEGHNTLVLAPDACEDQDPRAKATITRFVSAADGAFEVTDLSNAYRVPARRGVALFDRSRVVVQDELQLARPTEMWWFMHTRADITIEDGGKTAVLTQNAKTIRARLQSPAGGSFIVEDAAPLATSPNPAGQTPNTGVHKLSVHFTAAGSTTIAVAFDTAGGVPSDAVTSLDQWKLAGSPTIDITRPAAVTEPSANACDPPPSESTTTSAPANGTPAVSATPAFTG